MIQKIAIHSVPRSGSTWLGNIFNSHPEVNFNYQPLFSYTFKNFLNEKSSTESINIFFKELSKNNDSFINQTEGIKKGIIPDFEKNNNFTHICYKEVRYHHILKNLLEKAPDIKVIGLVRNPLSTISSWIKAPKEFRGDLGWKIDEEWKYASKKNLNKPEEFNGYEKWKEITKLFLELKNQYPQQFYLLNYDDLLTDINTTIVDLFSFCRLEMSPQTYSFINPKEFLNQDDAYSVFKSKKKDDEWKNNLPDYIIEEIKNDSEFQILNNLFNWI